MNEQLPILVQSRSFLKTVKTLIVTALCASLAALLVSCKTAKPTPSPKQIAAAASTNAVVINPGDVLAFGFPGAPNMNSTVRVRLDGKIVLPLISEVPAAGKSPAELQTELQKLYANELQIKEVVVSVVSTSASILVTGAVARPGRISMERPMTVLDAIMEAGGFDTRRANVKKVAVIRNQDGEYKRQTLNLKPVLKGENVKPFYLQPFDIVYVPEKIF